MNAFRIGTRTTPWLATVWADSWDDAVTTARPLLRIRRGAIIVAAQINGRGNRWHIPASPGARVPPVLRWPAGFAVDERTRTITLDGEATCFKLDAPDRWGRAAVYEVYDTTSAGMDATATHKPWVRRDPAQINTYPLPGRYPLRTALKTGAQADVDAIAARLAADARALIDTL